ncbi:MAG: hypothetical protein E6Q62_07060 [Nitrosomonas sp.]|nr:MAG: hypothetical protein E6Q62_07060 [Nitrosomonas sp.]
MADPVFEFVGANPFDLSNVGSRAKPSLVDIDNDGDFDAFIGDNNGNTRFFKNIGSPNHPFFAAAVNNPFGLRNAYGIASPTFVDIDGDGDLDAFIGTYYGGTLFFRNTGTMNVPAFSESGSFGLVIVEGIAIPSFVDIDGDGDLDAFIGTGASRYGGDYGGDVVFFKNTGTLSSPAFSAISRNPFGLSNVAFSASPTFVDIDDDGDQDAFIGNRTGDTQFFRNIGTPRNPSFAASELNPFGLLEVGFNATPTFVDIDSDSDLDAFIGNSAGDAQFFVNNGLLLANTLGNDILTGTPSSNDTLTYASATGPVTVSLNITTQQNTVNAGLDTIIQVENLIGSNFADNLTGNSANNILEGRGGNDTLTGWSGADTMIGGSGNDTYFVENSKDVVTENSSQGTDLVSSRLTYTLPANVENLTLTGTAAINGTGNDLNNTLTGNNAANELNGQAGNDRLVGGGGNDTLIGWSGADAMIGGPGNDTYFVENTGDSVTENLNQGTDLVSSRLTYTLPANVENLTLTGTAAVNGTGNGQANLITGNPAANQLKGLAGNDILDGGTGNNVLTGGTGNDFFRFSTTGHVDRITDYNVANDTVQLDNAVFVALTATGTLAAGRFRVGAQALDANDNVLYNKTAGTLWYDADGNGTGAAAQIAVIGSGLNLTNADIVVI